MLLQDISSETNKLFLSLLVTEASCTVTQPLLLPLQAGRGIQNIKCTPVTHSGAVLCHRRGNDRWLRKAQRGFSVLQRTFRAVQVMAFMATRSMTPWKLSSEPMGSVTTAGLAPSMLSIMLTVLQAAAPYDSTMFPGLGDSHIGLVDLCPLRHEALCSRPANRNCSLQHITDGI